MVRVVMNMKDFFAGEGAVKKIRIPLRNNVMLLIGDSKLENILLVFLFSVVRNTSYHREKSLEIMLYLKQFWPRLGIIYHGPTSR